MIDPVGYYSSGHYLYMSRVIVLVTELVAGLSLFGVWNPNALSPSLETHDALTRMLFLNCRYTLFLLSTLHPNVWLVSENIAPTLVAFDGTSNGYRSLLLPLAWEDDLVRCALLASSANHLRFRRPKLTNLALNFQYAAIKKLTSLSQDGDGASNTRLGILAALILLLISGMMNGGSDFELLLNMAKSWIEAMKGDGSLKESPATPLGGFLLDQVSM